MRGGEWTMLRGWSTQREPLCPQVVGALDLLLALLQGSPAQESLAIFLLEPGNLEVLLALLVRPRPMPLLPDRVCKVHPAAPQPYILIHWGPCLSPGRGRRPWAGEWSCLCRPHL